jgi:hypothetical protein
MHNIEPLSQFPFDLKKLNKEKDYFLLESD